MHTHSIRKSSPTFDVYQEKSGIVLVTRSIKMPSYARKFILPDDSFFHVTWQCHNKEWLLRSDWAKNLYYHLLLKYHQEYDVTIYSYNLMNSHPHLAGYTKTRQGLSDFMRRVNGIFSRRLNKHLNRCGQVVMDRFKSPQIQSTTHLLSVMSYLDLNPVRAKIVMHPSAYRWSSYGYYAFGKADPLITPSPAYLELSENAETRQRLYRGYIDKILATDLKGKDFSFVYFIGDPEWVLKRMRQLRAVRLADDVLSANLLKSTPATSKQSLASRGSPCWSGNVTIPFTPRPLEEIF